MRGRSLTFIVCLTFTVPLFAALTGTVVGPQGQPLAGARVAAYALELTDTQRARWSSATPEQVPLATVNTDSRGRFSFEGLKDPVVELNVSAAGHAPAAARAETTDEAGTITLTAAEVKQGRVTAAGKPVAGAVVIWTADAEVVAKTDEQGRYSVPDPAKWAERVIIRHPDFPLTVEQARRTPNQTAVAIDRTLAPGVAVQGRVVGSDGKTPVAGATVLVDGYPAGTTAEDGTFNVAHAPAKWLSIGAGTAGMRALKMRSTGDITLKMEKPATFSGVVRETKAQQPVGGVEVRLRPSGRFFDMYSPTVAITDAKGGFTANAVMPGEYEVVLLQPAYAPSPMSVSIASGQKVSRTLLMTQLARVSGTVSDEEKKPLGGVRVQSANVSREAGGPMVGMQTVARGTTTAPDGTFVLRVQPDSDIQLSALRKGYPEARSSTLRLNPGERKGGVALTVPAGVAVTGRVVDSQGKPVSGVTIATTPTSGSNPGQVQRMVMINAMRENTDDLVKTEADGTFSIRVKEGTYDLGFRREGYGAKSVRAYQVTRSPQPLEVTLEPGVEITGRVTRGGAGVEGVNVNAFGELSGIASAITGPDGSFRLSDLSPGTMMLSARKEEEFIQINRPVTAPAADLALEVPPGGRITGRVVDKATKQPVTTFLAGITPPRGGGMVMISGPPQFRSFTSEDGTFTLDNVPPGTLQLNVQAAGYTPGRVSNITVEEGRTVADIEVAMDRGARVVGRVTGPDGSALAGVAVRVDTSGAGSRLPMVMGRGNVVVTDASGEYVLEAVEPGEKTLVFNRSGFLPTQKTATISAGNDNRVDAQLSAGVRVSGTVVTDSGAPVAEATVAAQAPGQMEFGSRSTVTDANGNFTMDGLSAGRYTFFASKSGIPSTSLRDVDVSSGGPVRIVVQSGGTIYGRVTGLTPQELVQATVMASSSTGGNAQAAVDSNGNFRMEGAPTGTVRLSAQTMRGFAGGKTSPQISLNVAPGAQVQQDIEFKSGTVVRGRVTRDGRPLPDVMVGFFPRAAQAQTSARTTTDRDGYYEVSGLEDAQYTVSVNDIQRGIPHNSTYEVRGSGTYDIDIKAAALRGRVVDASSGEPIGDVIVQVRETQSMGNMMRAGQSDASGSFLIDGVTTGKYYLTAEKEGYASKLVDVTVGDTTQDVEIKLSRNAGVTMRVVDARDGRPINPRVRVYDAQNRVVFESGFRFGGGGGTPDSVKITVEPGTYRATVAAIGYAAQTIQLVSPSTPTVGLTPGGSIAVRSRGSALRRARLMAADGREYPRGGFGSQFTVDPNPGVTTLENIAPGIYTLQILGAGDEVETSTQVRVLEGQRADVEI